jgi:hypothetical protein
MDIEKIVAKCKQLHLFKTNKDVLFKSLNELDKDTLLALSDKLKPGDEFKPVILLRFLICQLLLSKVEVTEEVINNIKSSIENRDISEYYLASGVFIQKLKDYKISKKGMFPQWKEPFLVLFPFFYNESEREAVNLQLKEIANSIIDTHHLKNARAHTVDFYGSNHYGDDRVWLAIIPDAALSVQNAFQLFFTINSAGFEGGLNSGHKVAPKKQVREVKNYNTFKEYSAELEKIIPRWEGLNKEINFSHQKEEKDFKNRIKRTDENCLQLYFNLLDQLIAELDIPDEESLVFSTSSNQLSFQIGKRYCLNLKKDVFSFITPSDYEIAGISKGYFSEPDVAAYQKDVKPAEIVKHYDAIEQAVRYELDRDNHTKPKEYDNAVFRRAAFEKEYRQAFFNFIEGEINLSVSTTEVLNPMKNSMHLNQILYGPPGTGKTYLLQKDYFNRFTVKETSLTRAQYMENIVVDLTWWQVLSVAVLDLGNSKVSDIFEHEFVKIKADLSNSKSVRATLWGQLQSHTVMNCPHVNFTQRSEPLFFYKDENSRWSLDQSLLEEGYPEAFELLEQSKNFVPSADKVIKNYEFVTFHQSFGYEDFVEGIKPRMGESGSEVSYEIQDGVFKKLCQKAKLDPDHDYAIFIDEINRGNVSAIFGELITLIEKDKRLKSANELTVTLPYSKESFGVPKNLYVFGTMNTADRSVEALDTALRRRFAFKEILPDPELLENIQFDGFHLKEVLETINTRIEVLLDRDHTIGHSYFIHIQNGDTRALEQVFQNNVIPLLQEYFYNDYEKIALILGAGFVAESENKQVQFAVNGFKSIEAPETVTRFELKKPVDNILTAVKQLLNRVE